MFSFQYKDISSSFFRLLVFSKSVKYTVPKYKSVQVVGRDIPYLMNEGLDGSKFIFECSRICKSVVECHDVARRVNAWLCSGKGNLRMDHEPNLMYIAYAVIKDMTFDGNVLKFQVTFNCEPVAYDAFETEVLYTNPKSVTLENRGSYKTYPMISMKGSGNVTFGSMGYVGLTAEVYFDCENMLVYSVINGQKINRLNKFQGDFIVLNPGLNTFSVLGNIVELKIYYRGGYI